VGFITVSLRMKVNTGFCGGDGGCGGVVDSPSFLLLPPLPPSFLNMLLKVISPCLASFFALWSKIKKVSRRARRMLCRCFCEEGNREVFPPLLVSCGQAEPGIQSVPSANKTRHGISV
jgi:hypothetical protein